jgi:phosphatidylglycerol:prolipoprotein diacylglycerol transferase
MTESTHTSRWLGRKYFVIGRFRISTYAAMLYVGFILGVVLGRHVVGLSSPKFELLALILLIPALVGGRLWYLLQHPKTRLAAVGARSGGAGLYGGLVLSFAVSWPLLHFADQDFWRFWDGGAVVLLVGMTVTRMGCLMTGCCSGRPTAGPLGMSLPDEHGTWKRRYPTQILEALLSGAILAVGLWFYTPAQPAGTLFLGGAAAYSLGRIGLELLRAEATVNHRSGWINIAFSAALAVTALIGFALLVA